MRTVALTERLSSDKLGGMKDADIIGLKELREHVATYISRVKKGDSFIVVRRSKAVFRITSPEDDALLWEPVVDLTKIKNGGISLRRLLARL